MKDLHLLVWITQLGLSVAFPLGGFILLALWLRNAFGVGIWVVWVGLVFGLVGAVQGFRDSLKAMARMSPKAHTEEPPSISFNEHE